MRLLRHCFPWWWEALDAITDPRDEPGYLMRQVLNLSVLMFACRIGSLRQLDRVTDDALFRDNWCVFNRVRTDTVIMIAQGGRLRWTIENEGFNEQKTGYELEHFCDCDDLEVMTCL